MLNPSSESLLLCSSYFLPQVDRLKSKASQIQDTQDARVSGLREAKLVRENQMLEEISAWQNKYKELEGVSEQVLLSNLKLKYQFYMT